MRVILGLMLVKSTFLPCSSRFLCYWKIENLDKTKQFGRGTWTAWSLLRHVCCRQWSPRSPEGNILQNFVLKASFAVVWFGSMRQPSKLLEAALYSALTSLPHSLLLLGWSEAMQMPSRIPWRSNRPHALLRWLIETQGFPETFTHLETERRTWLDMDQLVSLLGTSF